MKQNRSLAISTMIEECQNKNIIGLLHDFFPAESLSDMSVKPTRDRVFNPTSTLLTMVLTSTQEDKTLKNSVDLYYGIHQNIGQSLKQKADSEFKDYLENNSPKVGRPRQKAISIAKSKEKNISLNTAAYSKARKRLPMKMVEQLFTESKMPNAKNSYSQWHGKTVLIGDGTYAQLLDTEEIREEFSLQEKDKDTQGYPKALIVGVIERGSGQLFSYDITNRDTSELEVFHKLIDQLPAGCVVLLDDLYNCYEIFAKCIRNKIDVIVPSKRKRNYQVVRKINDYDEIISNSQFKQPKLQAIFSFS